MRLREYQETIFFKKYRQITNYAFARWLGIHSTTLSRYYGGKSFFSAKTSVIIIKKCSPHVTSEDLLSTKNRKPKYKWAKLRSLMNREFKTQ